VSLLVASSVVLVYFWMTAAPAARLKPGEVAPDFNLPALDGASATSLTPLRGSPVLLTFFDTRWARSGAVLEDVDWLHRRYSRQGLVVLGVCLDPPLTREAVRAFLGRHGVGFRVLHDAGGAFTERTFGRPGGRSPATYLLRADGVIAAVHTRGLPYRRDEAARRGLQRLLPPGSLERLP
jgi:peroxiredoxin